MTVLQAAATATAHSRSPPVRPRRVRTSAGLRWFRPDAVADAQAGHLAPRGGYDRSTPTLRRIANGLAPRPAPGRNDRGWYSV